jgi:hypothetical protein
VSVEVDPRTIPELPVILRMDKLGKVRVLDVVCEHSHRLVDVLQIPGRGRLALGVDTSIVHGADTAHLWRWIPGKHIGGWGARSDTPEAPTTTTARLALTRPCAGQESVQAWGVTAPADSRSTWANTLKPGRIAPASPRGGD